ncbi:fatty-acid peroxygenase [Halobacillus dabanensis]|uniref:Fatty-acid peroxygenase n=1 Tax=Halobacillus dabanensis TaxID=240302 RepID=A0A1I3TVF9_HALDA|nr:cytochrome P450 [Halobacillus dabanensis]SFJ74620.1 fatty-acid peroxygenase [Halobacillus dabanensis]
MTVNVPKDKTIDNTLAIFKDGYNFIPKRVQNHHLDVYETRVLGEKVALLSGIEGAKLFYDTTRMNRKNALPKRVLKTLFGENGIQTMDGEAHKHRKLLFMSLMTPEALQELYEITTKYWAHFTKKWSKMKKVTLYDESRELLCRTACEWAGVPLKEKEVQKRTRDLSNMIDGFSAIGPKHMESRRARKRTEAWIEELILKVREGELEAEKGKAIYEMAMHKDLDGRPLDARMAAIELINIIRPLVAISKFITFGAVALQEYPETNTRVSLDDEYLFMFSQEVRRFYPFVPFLGARVDHDFTWQQYNFEKDQLVLIDVYGINHDPKVWENPDEFNPERFVDWDGGLFDLIPQGGGGYYSGHRCPGEWPTIEVLQASFRYMTKHLDYDVPKQDYSYSLRKMPSLPKSGFIMSNVHYKN